MRKFFWLVLFPVLLSGCGGSVMMQTDKMEPPTSNEVLVTFIRPSFYGMAASNAIWDSENLVGVTAGYQYVQYKTTPGKHLFMSQSENWSLVEANLLAGHHYLLRADIHPGVWTARTVLHPFNKNAEGYYDTVQGWIAGSKPVQLDPAKAEAYKAARIERVKKAIANYKSGDADFLTLEEDDYLE